MPYLRSVILSVLPKSWRTDAEHDSRLWVTECTACGNISNVWDLGGMRWRAAGKPLTLLRCVGCGKSRMQRIYKT